MPARPRILLVAPERPLPASVGGRQRSDLMYRALASFADVDLVVTESPERVPEEEQRVLREERNLVALLPYTPRGARGAWSVVRGLHPRFVDRLAHNLGSSGVSFSPDPFVAPRLAELTRDRAYDAVVVRYLQNAARTGLLSHPRCVVDADDLEPSVYRASLAEPGVGALKKIVLTKHLKGAERLVERSVPRASAVFVTNDGDAHIGSEERVSVLPNIAWSPEDADPIEPLPPADSPVISIIGSWNHAPNAHGLEWFLSGAWPLVRRACPEAELRVFGSRMSESRRDAWGAIDGVRVIGFADQIADVYRDAAFAICPVVRGGGTKIKVLEALAYGRTCVVTRHSFKGYEHTLGDGKLPVADDAEAFAEHCVRLLNDNAERDRLAEVGSRVVRERYSIPAFNRVVRDAFARLFDGEFSTDDG